MVSVSSKLGTTEAEAERVWTRRGSIGRSAKPILIRTPKVAGDQRGLKKAVSTVLFRDLRPRAASVSDAVSVWRRTASLSSCRGVSRERCVDHLHPIPTGTACEVQAAPSFQRTHAGAPDASASPSRAVLSLTLTCGM